MTTARLLKKAACVFGLVALACSGETRMPTIPPAQPPPEPPPQTSAVGGIGGYVFASSEGNCLVGARVEILDGLRAGAVVQQADCPFGDAYGYSFWDLPADTLVTLRVSAPGYRSVESRDYATVRVFQTNFILYRE